MRRARRAKFNGAIRFSLISYAIRAPEGPLEKHCHVEMR